MFAETFLRYQQLRDVDYVGTELSAYMTGVTRHCLSLSLGMTYWHVLIVVYICMREDAGVN